MGQIGTLVGGAAAVTVLQGQDQCEQYMLLGDVDTAMPLTGVSVEVEGETIVNVQGSTPLVSAYFKLLQQVAGTVVGLLGKFATGKIKKGTTYRLTNGGATTPAIFAYSEAANGRPIYANTFGIVASSYAVFRKFTFLLITPAANIGTLDIEWEDGNRNTITAVEADSLFCRALQTEANGRLDAVVSGIDNRDGSIKSIQINATTAVTVAVIKFDNNDYQVLRAEANAA